MLEIGRTEISNDIFTLTKLKTEKEFYCDEVKCFDCGHDDLNNFFRNDAFAHKKELLTETYYLQPKEATEKGIFFPVAFVSYLNDAVNIKRSRDRTYFQKYIKKIAPPEKLTYNYFPAVKIGRLGVKKEYISNGFGTAILNMTKEMFLTDNRTGCRFITVDAYNEPRTINFYQKNDFDFYLDDDSKRDARIMYFDLLRHEIQPH